MTTESAAAAAPEALAGQLKALGFKYIRDKDFAGARFAFQQVLELDSRDIDARFVYANLIDDGTHKRVAEARDLMLSILDEHPAICEHPTETNLKLIRAAASKCSQAGPFARAIELYRTLARASNAAGDYFQLSEILTQGNFFEEAVASLEKAIALDPATYDTSANRETLQIARSRLGPAISRTASGR
jgi:tetratricopeptide (TPR) repeat protein